MAARGHGGDATVRTDLVNQLRYLMELHGALRQAIEQIEAQKRILDVKIAESMRCRAGHIYDEANTYWDNGSRICRACRAERDRRKYRRRVGNRSIRSYTRRRTIWQGADFS